MSTVLRRMRGVVLLAGMLLCSLVLAPAAGAAPVTSELQKLARAASFEVVMRKPEPDRLTYEKPLPLELLPFTERNDKYWSLGTAFAIGPNLFVSAGHVIQQGVGSQYGVPSLRDVQGNVYPIDRILKYSVHQDFAVFSVVNPPAVTPLGTNETPAIDDAVYAVGNALGEGVVIRDGLLTSMTPEDQDGRWKWLRFSAAASPGNSGGPLLDAKGNVTGIVIARSESENLNYALPISIVRDDPGKTVGIDQRSSFGVPVFTGAEVATWKDSFPLPLPYPEFSKRMLASRLAFYETQRRQLLTARLPETFPRGESAKLLARFELPVWPSVLAQSVNHVWEENEGELQESFDLPDNGGVTLHNFRDVGLFDLKRSGAASDDAFYSDSRAFGDLLLKAVKLMRPVGSQSIRVTSLGAATKESTLVDRHGRHWQMRSWPVGFMDVEVMTLGLPTPQGYVGMLRFVPSAQHEVYVSAWSLLADYFQNTYSGSPLQWQAFLRRTAAEPLFRNIKLDISLAAGVKFKSSRFEAAVPVSMVKLSESAVIRLNTVLMSEDDKAVLDVGNFLVSLDRMGATYVSAKRQAKPAVGADKEAQDRWDRMMGRTAEFSGTLGHDEDYKAFWVRSAEGATRAASASLDPNGRVLYELAYRTQDRVSPMDMRTRGEELTRSFHMLEH